MNKKKFKVTTETKKVPEARARQPLALQELHRPHSRMWELGCGAAGTTQGSAQPSRSNLDMPGLRTAGTAKELHPPHPERACAVAHGPQGYVPEFGVVGELVWLFWTAAATACAAVTAVFAA